MPRTRFCELFGIEAPVLQAAIWPATSPELVAAVSEAGALGSIGTVFEPAERVVAAIERVRELTRRPFVVNHVLQQLDEAAFAATLERAPAAVSLALGEPSAELVTRAHDAGVKVIHQVHTVGQARVAAERGVDVIVAQGAEAGGQGLAAGVGGLALIPQVVDAVAPVPVLAAGGIADGRGLAAALVLGAAGANVGTRFLASVEASAAEAWKRAIVAGESEDAVRFETWSAVFPPAGAPAYETVPRVLRTPFVERWHGRREEAGAQADALRGEVLGSLEAGAVHETLPFAGQTVGLVHELRPAAEIVASMADEADRALRAWCE